MATGVGQGKLDALIKKRERYFARIQVLYDTGKKCYDLAVKKQPYQNEYDSFISRYQRVEDDMVEFEEVNNDIAELCASMEDTEKIEVHQTSTACDELYFNAKTLARKLKVEGTVTSPTKAKGEDQGPPSLPVTPRLPKLEIEPFDGSISAWPNFYSLFNSLIHNNKGLSKAEKLSYLRSLLKSHALSLIETLNICDENYDIAIHALIKRYQNKRLLATNYVDKVLSFRPLFQVTTDTLSTFLETFNTNLSALKALNISDLFDLIMLSIGLRALPDTLRKEFENQHEQSEIPSFEQLIKFVEQQLHVLNITAPTVDHATRNRKHYYTKASTRNVLLSHTNENKVKKQTSMLFSNTKVGFKCPCCNQDSHKLYVCPTFKEMEVPQRYEMAKRLNLCYRCLGFHKISDCKSINNCRQCSGKHHSLLHRVKQETSNPDPTLESSLPADFKRKDCNCTNFNSTSNAMLCTAIIGIQNREGKLTATRAILDGGSQTSLITHECVKRLGLKPQSSNVMLFAVGDTTLPTNRESVMCSISPINDSSIKLSSEALVVPKISSNQPNIRVDPNIRTRFADLDLSDENFDSPTPVEFLIGADLMFDIIEDSSNIIKGQPSAMKTIFGWVIGGRVPQYPTKERSTSLLTCYDDLNDSLRKFWEIESTSAINLPNPEDTHVEEHFKRTHTRDEVGRYEVSLPKKPNCPTLPNTRNQARINLMKLEARLKRNDESYREYRTFMDEYISSGHMSITKDLVDYIMPHHCITKESSSTTKLRTVFNASYKPHPSSYSLNDILFKGPKLQKDICDIITCFRVHEIVLCADIKQMYRQIKVNKNDRHLQHIFYRTDPNGNINEYELNVVTYGITSSAYLAQRVLLQLAEDEGKNYPLAVNAITQQTFVDDICMSADSLEQAVRLKQELIQLCAKGGFVLRKWSSNHKSLLNDVPPDHREKPITLSTDETCKIKLLGLQYDPTDDTFSYTIKPNPLKYTKRAILSEISRIYDILGWLTPVTFYAKNLIQTIWSMGAEWDEPLPYPLQEKWASFISTLHYLSQIRIQRHIPIVKAANQFLIGFCDASEKGYAANLYLRLETNTGIETHLLKAKSRVAPLKVISIPRLELCAAHLLGKLVVSSKDTIESLNLNGTMLFTDSTVVLSWIQTPPHKLKTFIANRVADIIDVSNPQQWRHVPTKLNPCDCASRGQSPKDLVNNYLWWNGPEFLKEHPDTWPKFAMQKNLHIPELKYECLKTSCIKNKSILLEVMEKCSSLSKVQWVIAYVIRFIRNIDCREKPSLKIKGAISPKEVNKSLMMCVKSAQEYYLAQLIEELRQRKPCSRPYHTLAPFLDDAGYIRVGGRLRHSKLAYAAKHPLLIPRSSRLATLICDYYHITSLHGGPRITQSLIQNKFWIIGVRQLLRERIFKCQRCYIFQAKPNTPIMADLPSVRFQNIRPFLNVGIDCAGPFEFKESGLRKSRRYKGYLVLFVCLSTKAVHLEFATSLSTPSFMLAFDRFVARRGLCKIIYSDCGTNFQGASNHLIEVHNFLKNASPEISHHLAKKEIKWKFNPPSAPHFGGIWEAAVKSAKHHLTRTLGNSILTYEEMDTLFKRIEAILNSRPIGAMTTDPNDGDYLSPGHFLVGTPLLCSPEIDYTETPVNRLTRFQLLQQAAQSFWKRWSEEYLQTLTSRLKWTSQTQNLKTGDVVYLQIKNTSPLEWPLGRIKEVFPGRDGTVRTVKIQTTQGTYIRPVHKLIPLPPADAMI